jgi:hypothetical protein
MENEIYMTLMIKGKCPETSETITIEDPPYVISHGDDEECISGHFNCPVCGKKHSYIIIL